MEIYGNDIHREMSDLTKYYSMVYSTQGQLKKEMPVTTLALTITKAGFLFCPARMLI